MRTIHKKICFLSAFFLVFLILSEISYSSYICSPAYCPDGCQNGRCYRVCAYDYSDYQGSCVDPGTCCGDECIQGSCGAVCALDSDCNSYDRCVGSIRNYNYEDHYCNTNCANCDCNSYTSINPDISQFYCDACSGTYWSIGGETAGSNCCGDDGSEYRRTCSVSGNTPESFSCSGDTEVCCDTSNDCVDDGGCYADGPSSCRNDAICVNGGWEDQDNGDIRCRDCGHEWNIGGETQSSSNYCCEDDSGENIVTEHSSTDAPAGYNSGNTACCDSWTDCADDDTCAGVGSTRGSVPFRAWCCNFGQAGCSASYWYGGDAYSAACTAITGNSILWNLGGGGDCTVGSCRSQCCGDDGSGEAYDYCQKNAAISWSCLSTDDTCCDVATDCVDPVGTQCKTSGSVNNVAASSTTDDYAWCSSSIWYDCDDYESSCGSICANGGTGGALACGEVFGECGSVGESDCCGDDSGENYRPCVDSSGQGSCGAVTQACCNAAQACIDQNGACRSTGVCYGAGIFGNSFCNAGSWEDPDEAFAYCVASCDVTSGDAGIGFDKGGEIAATGCCGDDSSEYLITEIGGTDAPAGYNDGIDTCCNAATDCTYNDDCVASGGVSLPAIPNKGYCNAGTWQGGDAGSTQCSAIAGPNRWSLGGEVAATACCGDDLNEYSLTRVCDGYACASSASDDACCNANTDCVWNSACYNNGAAHPTQSGAICSSGTWRDVTAPDTVINPNGGDFTGSNETTITLSCSDIGGAGCKETRYRIVDDGQQGALCAAYGNLDRVATTWPVMDQVTCPFGQICNKRVCFASQDNAGNIEAMNVSNVFHLETNACQGRVCGQTCLYTPGICNATNGNCYTNGGCRLNCSVPQLGPGQQRVWYRPGCGRSNATKCDNQHVCANSITDNYCSTGGASTIVTGNWNSYTPTSGYYGVGGMFHIRLFNVLSNPSQFSILAECLVVKANGNMIVFDSWGNGDTDFSYTITASDPEGEWNVTYCGLWSDFLANGGWQMKLNNSVYRFYVDKTGPSITINNPISGGIYNNDILVNATITDAGAGVDIAIYRWTNSTDNGTWMQMTRNGNQYTATLSIAQLVDGAYNLSVWANDTVGNFDDEKVLDFRVDRQPPSITVFSPSSGWYRANFDVKARVTDNQGISSVRYRWVNATNNGAWTAMSLDASGNYTTTFTVASVSPGNYTFVIRANDTMGNNAEQTVAQVGIDYIAPMSVMTKPMPPGSFVMSPKFNISWSGSDAHSGVKCYVITFWYCDQKTGLCADNNYNVSFPGGQCTSLIEYEFDTSKETFWISDPNNYTFFFKSLAMDNAGNMQAKAAWDTNVTIYIPKLVTFSVTENTTKANIRNGGKVANNRVVIISAKAKPDVTGNLNITVYYTNHTLGLPPAQWSWSSMTCRNVRECNASIAISVSESEVRKEVDYYIYAENSTQMSEYLPPNAPTGYFYYTVYNHSICNFLVINEFRTLLGSSDLIALEVRNINDRYDNVTLQLLPSMGRFLETNNDTMNIVLLPQEEKIIYARIVASANDFPLTVVGASEVDLEIRDEDTIQVVIGFPPNFYELSDFAIAILVLLACAAYFAFVRKE